MPRPVLALIALSLALQACAKEPRPEIKPVVPLAPKATTAKPAPIVSNIKIQPVRVSGADGERIALAMFHGLNLAGHDINSSGDWTVTGEVTGQSVVWSVRNKGRLVGTLLQAGTTDAATFAIVPGVRTYLPKPRSNLGGAHAPQTVQGHRPPDGTSA